VKLPSKVQICLSLAFLDVLPTRSNLAKRQSQFFMLFCSIQLLRMLGTRAIWPKLKVFPGFFVGDLCLFAAEELNKEELEIFVALFSVFGVLVISLFLRIYLVILIEVLDSTSHALFSLSNASSQLKLFWPIAGDKHWVPPSYGCLNLNIIAILNGVNWWVSMW
ncbi:hypothetical protein TorRG33x02_097620, partial [Trema orientale]